tara:strand:- start:1001 stop:1255 length:255 start_codon:yes stop_codon:yes gene_type:complete
MSFIKDQSYPLNYTWTDKLGQPQHASVSAIFTGKIFLISGVEFGEFIHQNAAQKVRHLSLAMLDSLTPKLDRVIADGEAWGEEA